MVVTPWGDSEELRERRLPPGPGTEAQEVARNQRERLFAAMVASVCERGYAATRVTDLVAMSGVSTRSFYSLFEDKEALLLATIEALIETGTATVLASAEGRRDWGAAAVERCAQLLAEDPVAARVCLVDSLGAGPIARDRLDQAAVSLENLMAEVAARRLSAAPRELYSAWVGGLLELTRRRLLDGVAAEIPRLFADFASIFRSYKPPDRELRLAARPPVPHPGSIEGHDHAERAIRAFTAVIAEHGYEEASVEETLRRASMSSRTFYANFAGKEDVLLAAIESAGSQTVTTTVQAFRRTEEWVQAVRAALGAFLNFLAFRPELASVLLLEYASGGPEGIKRRAEALRPLEGLLAGGSPEVPMPNVTGEVMVACVLALAGRVMAERGAVALPALAPICTHLVLSPFIGGVAAVEVANGDGRSRSDPELLSALKHLTREPLPLRILWFLDDSFKSVGEIAAALSVREKLIEPELSGLEAEGYVEVKEGESTAGGERLYRSLMRNIPEEEWERLSKADRAAISERIIQIIISEISDATAGGSFDIRVDRALVHFRGLVDEAAWVELAKIYRAATEDSARVFKEATARLAESGEEPIDVSAALMVFEMPKPG